MSCWVRRGIAAWLAMVVESIDLRRVEVTTMALYLKHSITRPYSHALLDLVGFFIPTEPHLTSHHIYRDRLQYLPALSWKGLPA